MYDFHIHSNYSMDSETPMKDIVLSSIQKKIKAICFTDHFDLDSSSKRIDFTFNLSDYFEEIKLYKEKFLSEIEIFSGIEIGIQPHLFKEYNEIIGSNNFDFVIMSVHSVNRKDIYLDKFSSGISPKEALYKYYSDIYECVSNFNNYDVVGHLDYIDRYFDNFNYVLEYKELKGLLENILKMIIKNNKGLEINTSGKRYDLDYFHPKIEILKMYKDLGGEIITIGSDSHSIDSLGDGYNESIEIMKNLGFEEFYIFKSRNKIPISI